MAFTIYLNNIKFSGGSQTIVGGNKTDHIVPSDFDFDAKGEPIGIEGGNDTIFGLDANDFLAGGDGNDRLFGGADKDVLIGGSGNDLLFGGSGDDTISGNGGDDTIAVETNLFRFGTDMISGGTGFDRVVFQTATVTEKFLNAPSVTIADARTGVAVDLTDSIRSGTVRDFELKTGVDGDVSAADTPERGRIIDKNFTDPSETSVLKDIEAFELTSHDDFFLDSSANHIIRAGAGNDFISGGAGFDVIDGGSGNDTALYRSSNAGVSVSLLDFGSGGSGSGGDAQGDTLIGIENVYGSNHSDFLLGDANNNQLRGFAGDDTISSGAGNDIIAGGEGNDSLRGGTGDDKIDGGLGNDTARFLDWNGTSDGLLSTIRGNITLGEGDAVSLATLTSSRFDFTSRSIVTNTLETDRIVRIENVEGSKHDDTITGNSGDNILDGRDGDDVIDGGDGNDTLTGGSGDDTLTGSAGADALNGGDGIDTASYRASSGVIVNLALNQSSGGDAAGDTFFAIENLTGSDFNDTLAGDDGNNVLRGEAGNDLLIGGAGADALVGGDGLDVISYAASNAVNIDLAANTGFGGDADGDSFDSIEAIIGSGFNDRLTGDDADNYLYGGGGNDTIEGGAGADHLEGGAGVNTLSYMHSAGVSVSLDGNLSHTGVAEGDDISGFQNLIGSLTGDDVLRGDGFANEIFGLGGDDRIEGGAGADILYGGSGFDFAVYERDGAVNINLVKGIFEGAAAGDIFDSIEGIIGGSGNNVMKGGDEDDTFIATDRGDNVLRGRGGDDTLTTDAGRDRLIGGNGNDLVSGGADDDRLVGNSGNDVLNGGTGDDILKGSTGDDLLVGGLGNDTFVFTGRNSGNDTIADFVDGFDVIRFKSGLVDDFDDLTITGNGTQHATVIYGDQSIDIFSSDTMNLSSDDFAII